MGECDAEKIEGYNRLSIICSELNVDDCLDVDETRVIVLTGCGRRYVIIDYRNVESLRRLIGSMASGSLEGFTGCRLGGEPSIAGYGIRGILARVDGLLFKLSLLGYSDNLEDSTLKHLNRVKPGIAPELVCSTRYRGVLVGIATVPMDADPIAAEYIASASASASGGPVVPDVNTVLARGVADLHLALYSCGEDWCRPRRASISQARSWASRVSWRSRLLRRLGGDSFIREVADALEDLARGLMEVAPQLEGDIVMRIHGDLHLYQVYRTRDGRLMFTDFEGEPYREPARRDELEPPVRDLASLIRSMDYAGGIAFLEKGVDAEEASLRARRELREWRRLLASSLVSEYSRRVEGTPLELDPEGLVARMAFWLVERASYEIVYEIAEETGLHYIPANAILEMRDAWPGVAW